MKGEWLPLGRTPIADARLPIGALRWRVAKDGFETREFIARSEVIPPAGMKLALSARGTLPADMLPVPGTGLALTLNGYDYTRSVTTADFLIDTFEVTNRQFKEFVDAGGYTKRQYWNQPFVRDGRSVPWDQAVAEFRDRTGRPGPAAWEVGTYPAGRENYPVSGVSWFEAFAYAEFAGKSLPTVYHWVRAAGIGTAAFVTPLSNLDGQGPAPVGQYSAVSPVGAYDMAGNVKEWCWNAMAPGTNRYLLGGAWNDPPHMFVHADARSPFDRGEMNGFRLVKYSDGKPPPETLTRDLDPPMRDFRKEKPVSDQVFEVFRHLYAYDPRPLDARVESVDTSAEQWTKEKVSISAAYGDERLTAYLFLPKNARPPFQTIVYAPGANSIQLRSSATVPMNGIDFLMIGGRAVLFPVYKGTFERGNGRTSVWPERTRAYQDWMIQIVNDARRGVDYLQTRPEIRRDAIAYYGQSWGAMFGSIVVALEPRFKAAVLTDGGLTPSLLKPPEVDQFNFAPRVSVPALMVNGDSDFIYQADISQKPLFALLGAPSDRKRYVVLHGGHGVIGYQRSQVVREILDWFDRYLGPVER